MYIAGMVTVYVSDLGQRVRQLRAANGWSQEQLTQAATRKGEATVSRGWLSQIESGDIERGRSDLINQLALALNTSVDYLLNGAPPEGVTLTVPVAVAPTVSEIAQTPALWRSLRAFLAASRHVIDDQTERTIEQLPDEPEPEPEA